MLTGKSENVIKIALTGLELLLPVTIAAISLKSVLPYIFWIAYSAIVSKLTGAKLTQCLKDDSKTFIAAILLFTIPLTNLIKIPEEFGSFSYLPKAMILTTAISLFIALKVYFLAGRGRPGKVTEPIKKAITRIGHMRIVYLATAAYMAAFTGLSIARHHAFNTRGFDLGIFDQTLWGLANNHAIFSTVVGDYLFSHHAFFLFFPLSLVYRLASSVELLLILQSIVLGLGAIPLYSIARKRLGGTLALLPVVLYLLYPSLNYVNLEDFHIETFAITSTLLSFYFLEQKRAKLFLAAITFTALIKEDAALIAMTTGMYAVIFKRMIKTGFIAILISLIVFLAATQLFMPHFSGGKLQLEGFESLGTTFPEIVKNLVLHPASAIGLALKAEKFAYLAMLLLPLVAIPLLAPEVLFGALPAFAVSLLSNQPQRYSIFFHYSANIIPFVFVALIVGLGRFQKIAAYLKRQLAGKTENATAAAVMAATIAFLLSLTILSAYSYGPLPGSKSFSFDSYNYNSEHAKAGREILKLIPQNASVSASNTAVPHLSQRESIYTFPNPFHKSWYLTDEKINVSVDFILIDLADPLREGIMTKEQFSAYLNESLNSPTYEVIDSRNQWVLLGKRR